MNKEIKSLELLVKHYEDKEKKLKEFIEDEIKSAKVCMNETDSYNLKMNWSSYKRALNLVLDEIEKLERVK